MGISPTAGLEHRNRLLRPLVLALAIDAIVPQTGVTMMHLGNCATVLILAGIYLVGAVALIWAPETKDKPLPEDSG